MRTEERYIEILKTSDLFKEMKESEIEVFLSSNTYKIKEFNKSDIFALAGDKVNHLMVVIEGNLIARMVSESGKYIQIEKIGRGRVIAPAMLFSTDNGFPVNVIPEERVIVFFMHKESFIKALRQSEQLLYNFMRIISDINRFLTDRIHTLSLKSIRGKLAAYIIEELENQKSKQTISIQLTRQELADKFAISRQALSRSLSELEEEGLISVNGREIRVNNRLKLISEE